MERKNSIDLLRIVSCFAVIAIHVISGPMTNYSGVLDDRLVSALEKTYVLMHWAVPVFFMITGYCIFRKPEYTYRACFRHVGKFVFLLATAGFLFAVMEEFFNIRTVSLSLFLTALQNVVSGKLWDHMWYLYAIIGIYLVLPVLHPFMSSNRRNRLIFTGLMFVFTIVLPTVENSIAIGIDIPFGGYLFYVCFGGVVAKGDLGKKTSLAIVLLGLAAAVYILLTPGASFGYRSLPVCLMAGGIFVLFTGWQVKGSPLLTAVSRCTLGVYIIHPVLINVAVKVLKWDFLTQLPYLKLTALYAAVCLISFTAIYTLRRVLAALPLSPARL